MSDELAKLLSVDYASLPVQKLKEWQIKVDALLPLAPLQPFEEAFIVHENLPAPENTRYARCIALTRDEVTRRIDQSPSEDVPLNPPVICLRDVARDLVEQHAAGLAIYSDEDDEHPYILSCGHLAHYLATATFDTSRQMDEWISPIDPATGNLANLQQLLTAPGGGQFELRASDFPPQLVPEMLKREIDRIVDAFMPGVDGPYYITVAGESPQAGKHLVVFLTPANVSPREPAFIKAVAAVAWLLPPYCSPVVMPKS